MRILLTESEPGAADESEKQLREAGYDISFCHEALRRDAERAAKTALQANGYEADVDVAVAHAAGSTTVFLHVLGLSDNTARAEAADLVREAVRGHRDLDEDVTVVTVPEDWGR